MRVRSTYHSVIICQVGTTRPAPVQDHPWRRRAQLLLEHYATESGKRERNRGRFLGIRHATPSQAWRKRIDAVSRRAQLARITRVRTLANDRAGRGEGWGWTEESAGSA